MRLVFDVRCCRCRCVVKEEDDEFFVEKALQQNKGADTFEKFKIFTRFWCVLCVLIYDF